MGVVLAQLDASPFHHTANTRASGLGLDVFRGIFGVGIPGSRGPPAAPPCPPGTSSTQDRRGSCRRDTVMLFSCHAPIVPGRQASGQPLLTILPRRPCGGQTGESRRTREKDRLRGTWYCPGMTAISLVLEDSVVGSESAVVLAPGLGGQRPPGLRAEHSGVLLVGRFLAVPVDTAPGPPGGRKRRAPPGTCRSGRWRIPHGYPWTGWTARLCGYCSRRVIAQLGHHLRAMLVGPVRFGFVDADVRCPCRPCCGASSCGSKNSAAGLLGHLTVRWQCLGIVVR